MEEEHKARLKEQSMPLQGSKKNNAPVPVPIPQIHQPKGKVSLEQSEFLKAIINQLCLDNETMEEDTLAYISRMIS